MERFHYFISPRQTNLLLSKPIALNVFSLASLKPLTWLLINGLIRNAIVGYACYRRQSRYWAQQGRK